MSGEGAPEIIHTDGTGLKITIVAGQWHDEIAAGLLEGAIRALTASNVSITVVRVPGSFELPWFEGRSRGRARMRWSR